MIFKLETEAPGRAAVHAPWVYVDDIDGHYGQARAAGATIVTELASPWGLPFYVADDLEGNRWTFAQAVRRCALHDREGSAYSWRYQILRDHRKTTRIS